MRRKTSFLPKTKITGLAIMAITRNKEVEGKSKTPTCEKMRSTIR
jgi:hypothetical protein